MALIHAATCPLDTLRGPSRGAPHGFERRLLYGLYALLPRGRVSGFRFFSLK